MSALDVDIFPVSIKSQAVSVCYRLATYSLSVYLLVIHRHGADVALMQTCEATGLNYSLGVAEIMGNLSSTHVPAPWLRKLEV